MDPLPRPCSLSPSAATQPPGSIHGRRPGRPRSVVPYGSPGFGGYDGERGDGRDHDVTGTAGTTGQGGVPPGPDGNDARGSGATGPPGDGPPDAEPHRRPEAAVP